MSLLATFVVRFGYYVQMLAAFLLLALGHYFAAAFLPIADCDETYNFVEPIHYLLYGNGMQTWENCPQYGLRSYVFAWIYAWPAVLIRGASGLSSVDVYYYLRIFNGRIACLCELFFVYSVWSVFSGKAAMVVLMMLFLNYPVAHAAVSVLPTSFVMCCYFVALGCWLRTRSNNSASWSVGSSSSSSRKMCSVVAPQQSRESCLFFVWATVMLVVLACVVGWPFAGLVAVPCALDLLLRFPAFSFVCLITSLAIVCSVAYAVDSRYYCTPTLSAWNVIKYNMFGANERGPNLYGTEPPYFFFKNLLLNFHMCFLVSLVAPVVVLMKRKKSVVIGWGTTRGRLLLYMSPFFLWLAFWTIIPHKEERFFAPAYPFLLLSASIVVTQIFFPDSESALASEGQKLRSSPTADTVVKKKKYGSSPAPARGHPFLFLAGVSFLVLFGTVSWSRAMAIYHFYSGPERMLYDWSPLLTAEAVTRYGEMDVDVHREVDPADRRSIQEPLTICVGKEWYRFPSSFFIDHRCMRYRFIKTKSFDGMLPVPFKVPAPAGSSGGLLYTPQGTAARDAANEPRKYGACVCGAAGLNDMNRAIPEQYVQSVQQDCDIILDSLSPDPAVAAEERAELELDSFPHEVLQHAALRQAMEAMRQPYHPVDSRYAIIDVERTPMWCRVLYYPFGISQGCAAWRPLVLRSKRQLIPG